MAENKGKTKVDLVSIGLSIISGILIISAIILFITQNQPIGRVTTTVTAEKVITTRMWIDKNFILQSGEYYSICGRPSLDNSSFEISFKADGGNVSFIIMDKEDYDRLISSQSFGWFDIETTINEMHKVWKPQTNEEICFVFVNTFPAPKIINATIYEKGYNSTLTFNISTNRGALKLNQPTRPTMCLLPAPFSCQIQSFDTNGILTINLTQRSGQTIIINRITCVDNALLDTNGFPKSNSYWTTSATGLTLSINPLPNGSTTIASGIKCYTSSGNVYTGPIGSSFEGTLVVNYTLSFGAYAYSSGSISVTVT
jgi:hypothetical protein